jgi:cation/acetate symporter
MAPVIEQLRAAPGVTGGVPAAIITIISTGTVFSTAALIALMAATISTGSACALYIASSLATDVVRRYLKPDISEKGYIWLIRIVAIAMCVAAVPAAITRGYLLGGFLWIFSSSMPVLIFVPLALFWRRNSNAAIWTTIINFIALYVWLIFYPSIGPALPSWMQAFGFVYITFILSIILYPVLTLILPGTKTGLEVKREV